MFAPVLYAACAAACLGLTHRFVSPLSRRNLLLLALLPLVFTGPALLTGRVYAPIDLPYQAPPLSAMAAEYGIGNVHNGVLSDIYCQFIPWKKASRDAWLRGEVPLWNPYTFTGDVLAASAQPAVWSPVFLLSLLVPLAQSLTFIAAITLFFGGLWMFVWLRDIDCSENAALLGAVAWMFGNFMAFWLEWDLTPTFAWMPLVFTAIRRIVRHQPRGFPILTIAFVMTLLAGHPESALHLVLLSGAIFLWELASVRPARIFLVIGRTLGAGVLALLLTAVYLLPIIEAIPQTWEHGYRKNIYSHLPRAAPPDEVVASLILNLIPFRYGGDQGEAITQSLGHPFAQSAYAGSLLLPLWILGLWKSRWKGRWLMLGFLLFGLLAGADAPWISDFLARLPLLDISINNRLSVAALFSVATLAALGTDAWLSGEQRRLERISVAALIVLAGVVILFWPAMSQGGLSRNYLIARASFYLIPPVLALAALVLTRKRVLTGFAIVLLLLLGQRTLEIGHLYPTLPANSFYPPIPGLENLPDSNDHPYRIAGLGYTLIPATATMYGLEDVRAYQAMTFSRLRQTYDLWCTYQPVWFNLVDDLNAPFLSFLNVRFVIAEPGAAVPNGWSPVVRNQVMTLMENRHVLPRAFVPPRIRINIPPGLALSEMASETNFGARSWIEHPGGGEHPGEISNGPGRVEVRSRGMNGLHLRADMEAPGWVVISESAWKGWKALEGDREIPLRFANHAFLGFHLPAGHHEIDLVYAPRSFTVGATISLLTLFAILAIWLLRRRRRGAAAAMLLVLLSLGCGGHEGKAQAPLDETAVEITSRPLRADATLNITGLRPRGEKDTGAADWDWSFRDDPVRVTGNAAWKRFTLTIENHSPDVRRFEARIGYRVRDTGRPVRTRTLRRLVVPPFTEMSWTSTTRLPAGTELRARTEVQPMTPDWKPADASSLHLEESHE